jgi:hypothetical protein
MSHEARGWPQVISAEANTSDRTGTGDPRCGGGGDPSDLSVAG